MVVGLQTVEDVSLKTLNNGDKKPKQVTENIDNVFEE